MANEFDIKDLNQDEIDTWGAWLNLTGKMPSVGRGKQATKVRVAILKSAAKQALGNAEFTNDPKRTPDKAALETVAKSADTKSIQTALNFLEKQTSSMGSFVQNMDAQIDRVGQLTEDLKTFDTRLLNVPLRTLRSKIVGSPLQQKYDLYLAEIEREIAKLSQGATASIAAMSVEEVKVWDRIHDKNLSVKDMLEVLKETRHAADLRMQSVEDELQRTRTRMRTREYPTRSKFRKNETPVIDTQEEYDALPSGSLYIDKQTGNTARKP